MPASANSCAADSARTVRSPPAVTVLLRTEAEARAGCSPLKAVEMSGSPSRASTALNRMFEGRQPMVLKASTTLSVVQPSRLEVAVASMAVSSSARTSTSPVVVTRLSSR